MSTATLVPRREAAAVVRLAGLLTIAGAVIGVVGGLVLAFVPPSPAAVEGTFAYPLDAVGHTIAQSAFALNHVLLGAGVLVATLAPEAAHRPGRPGGWIALAALAALTAAELWGIALADAPFPSEETAGIDTLYGLSSVGIGVGLVLLGIGIARDRTLHGLQRWITLVVGAMVFVVVIPGIMLGFVAGRLVLVAWQVAWVVFGLAIVRRAGRPGDRPAG